MKTKEPNMTETGMILWVDDEIDILKPHIELLQYRGYTVDTATNGEDAIELFKRNHYRLVFLDESMIGLSGLETLEQLKQLDPSVPVVMVTKNEAESLMEEAIGRKIDDYLTKPVNPAQILAACKKFLESTKISQQHFTQEYLRGFNEITMRLSDDLRWEDWTDIYTKLVQWSIELDRYPDLGLKETLQTQWKECNAAFSRYVEQQYEQWVHTSPKDASADVPLLSPHILDHFVLPQLDHARSVFFFVIDCLRLDQWMIIAESLRPYYTMTHHYYCSILPTATSYARNALFSGLFPQQIQRYYPQMWLEESEDEYSQNKFEPQLLEKFLERRHIPLTGNFRYVKIYETDFGRKIEQEILHYTQSKLNAIVVNAVDMIAHSRADSPILKEIAPDESAYRSLTRSWFQHSSLYGMLRKLSKEKNIRIVITSDHGAIRCLRGAKVFGDRETSTNLRFKYGRNVNTDPRYAMIVDHPERLLLPKHSVVTNYIFAKEDFYFVYPTDYHYYLNYYRDSFQHGGISMEEMILPVVILEPKI